MNKLVASSIAIALFLLAGCAASGPRLANSAEDIVGTWKSSTSSTEVQFNEDGTTRYQFPSGAIGNAEFRFEGTRFFEKHIDSSSGCLGLGAETGIYEIELLENGNLKFTVIEDECPVRVNTFVGALIEREWEPVP